MNTREKFDIVIVGGSYAGLSAAMSLGRAIRKVLIIDSGSPCNIQTPHSHNFLTQDGATPAAIGESAKKQVLAYPTIRFLSDTVTSLTGEDNSFEILTEGNEKFAARKVLFATGVKDLMPDIPGFRESWGISVIHCPYCHGYEYKGQVTGILVNGETAFEFARLIRNWTDKLYILTHGAPTFDSETYQKINALGIKVIETEIKSIDHENGHISGVVLQDGTIQYLEALYARIPFRQHCGIPEAIGCKMTDMGHIQADDFQKTSIPGIFAAGDCTTPMRNVANSVGAGSKAGAFINHQLLIES